MVVHSVSGTGQCCKPAWFRSYCLGSDLSQDCTLDRHWLKQETKRMERVLLVGGWLCVSWGCPFRVSGAYFAASPTFFSSSFVLFPLFCRHWSHHRWGLNCCHSTQLNHLVCYSSITLGDGCMTSLWLISAIHRPWGVFPSLPGEVREALEGVCTQTYTPFHWKTCPFYNLSLFL